MNITVGGNAIYDNKRVFDSVTKCRWTSSKTWRRGDKVSLNNFKRHMQTDEVSLNYFNGPMQSDKVSLNNFNGAMQSDKVPLNNFKGPMQTDKVSLNFFKSTLTVWRGVFAKLHKCPLLCNFVEFHITFHIDNVSEHENFGDIEILWNFMSLFETVSSVLTLMGSVAMDHKAYDRLLTSITCGIQLFPENWQNRIEEENNRIYENSLVSNKNWTS